MTRGKRNRIKGHNAERHFVNIFKENGFPTAISARYGSREKDDCGIDILNIPVNVQVKAGYARGLNYSEALKYTKDKVLSDLGNDSHEARNPTIVIHRKDAGRGRRRTEYHDIVSMTFVDFLFLFNKAYNQ